MMAAVFSMQGLGMLSGAIVGVVFLNIFKSAINDDINNLDYVWRLCIAFGSLPCLAAFYFRLTVPETPRYTMQVENNINKGVSDVNFIKTGIKEKHIIETRGHFEESTTPKASFKDFKRHFGQWKNLKILLGTSICW
jgi:PHS family inorganic phosphate transporter-like MFS transporter